MSIATKRKAVDHDRETKTRALTRSRTNAAPSGVGVMEWEPASTAMQNVFGVPELLEQILLQLSLQDVFVYQRVSRHFLEIIKRSVALQEKLFLRPALEARLRESIPLSENRKTDCPPFKAEICPLLEAERAKKIGKGPSGRPVQILTLEATFDECKLESGPSWSDMYLTQPPALDVSYKMCWRVEGVNKWNIKTTGYCSAFGSVSDAKGITFGRMLEQVLGRAMADCDVLLARSVKPDPARHGLKASSTVQVARMNNGTVEQHIQLLEEQLDGAAELVPEQSYIWFKRPQMEDFR